MMEGYNREIMRMAMAVLSGTGYGAYESLNVVHVAQWELHSAHRERVRSSLFLMMVGECAATHCDFEIGINWADRLGCRPA